MGFCAPRESGWAVVVGPAVLGSARRPGRNGTMGDLATKQSNWVRLFNVANEFDSWGQIAEAEENYVKVISQIQSDRAEWTTGTVSRFDNVSRLATLRVANRVKERSCNRLTRLCPRGHRSSWTKRWRASQRE